MKLTNRTKEALLRRLAAALAQVTEARPEDLLVFDRDGRGWPQLCWDGPFEWTMITAGSSVYSGETGRYSTPTEEPIQKVLDAIRERGGYVEVADNVTVAIFDA